MVELQIVDVEMGNGHGDVYCQDMDGFYYKFPVEYSKAKFISLLMHGVYVPSNGIYELMLKLLNSIGLSVDAIIVLDGYENKAAIRVINSNSEPKFLPINIEDGLVLGVLADAPFYIKREAAFLEVETIEDSLWYRLLKELDLC
ncbi:hypothetical protein [Hippea maritima]|uniref:BFN domain-containing protein n=1 Tax=Hippea maritima (strain ATCC 700847 / DSM 10411 / MH2) TaxID=760142 RepID=F2LWG2_HIPMA|nr:hypothetical protein [Hippea maritima]AEA33008.1 hypothetical protein Hipma_0025 [Hippea maritima DSM 10411]